MHPKSLRCFSPSKTPYMYASHAWIKRTDDDHDSHIKKKKIARAFRRLSSGNLPGVSKMYPFKFILVQNNLQPKGTI